MKHYSSLSVAIILFTVAAIGLTSCSGIGAGISGQTPPLASLKRENGLPFNVAAQDVARAESQPGKWWGLYDGGAIGSAIGQVVAGK